MVQVSGGKSPFEYQWGQESLTGENPNALAAGQYQLTVTDAAGNETNATILLEEPTELTASISPKSPASTDNADGQATVKVEGGTGDFTYKWDTGETAATATTLAAGSHTVTVTDQAGCTATADIEIGEDILPLAIELKEENKITCAGETNGAITVDLSGGKGPFEFQWGQENITGENPKGLAAGQYQLTVTDAAGNVTKAAILLEEPIALSASITPNSPATPGNADGQATAKVEGGTGDYSYKWDTGETEATATTLATGNHTLTITDQAACTTTATIEIGEEILPLAIELNGNTQISCAGEKDAAIKVEVSGGKAPFEYLWNEGGLTGDNLNGLAAGTYEVTVSDATGSSVSSKIIIEQPEPIVASINLKSPANPDQADGQAIALVKGGSGKYTFIWDNGEKNATATQLNAGTHSVTIEDENGCFTTSLIEVGEDIQPLVVQLRESASIGCAGENNAAVTVEITGGKAPFDYQWSNAAISGENADGLMPGNYQITITDAEGTKEVAKIEIIEPTPISIELSQTSPASPNNADGIAQVKVKGGSGKYTYKWANGETTAKAEKLALGVHAVTVSDDNGCAISGEVEIDENILPLAVSLEQTAEINCADEENAALAVNVKGGKSPYQYKWNSDQLDGPNVTGLAPAIYEVTVSDVSGQTKVSKIKIIAPKTLKSRNKQKFSS